MKNLRCHFFVCVNKRPFGMKQSCGGSPESTAQEVFQKLAEAVNKHMLWYEVLVSSSGCLSPCGAGGSIVVYPEGTWYSGVKPDDVEEIVQQHMLRGKPVERLIYHWPEQYAYTRNAEVSPSTGTPTEE